jgi:hypothetical protein
MEDFKKYQADAYALLLDSKMNESQIRICKLISDTSYQMGVLDGKQKMLNEVKELNKD